MRQRNAGVTLIELMIVVVIVGILAAIAYPSYRQYILRSGRTEAKTALLSWAQTLEKCFTRFGAYNDPGCAAATNVTAGAATSQGRYQVTPTAAIGVTTFTLQAVPQGGQVADTSCGTFTLNETGLRGVTGSATVQMCW